LSKAGIHSADGADLAAVYVERGNRCSSDGVYERAIADYDYTVAIDLDASEEV